MLIHTPQMNEILGKILDLPGMKVNADDEIMVEDGGARDDQRTHLIFLSNRGVNDDANGLLFAQFLRDKGLVVDQRKPKRVTVRNVDLVALFA